MLFLFIAFMFFCLYGISFVNASSYNDDFLSRKRTTMINGIFVVIIVFSHFNSYVRYTNALDIAYNKTILGIGQLMVTTFFFYSGYGIYESIKKNGEKYIDGFLKKRFLKVFVSFALAVMLYLILNLILVKETYSLRHILLAFTGWTSIGNSNWFIFATFYLYLATYTAFRLFRRSSIDGLMLLTILTLLYIYVVRHLKAGYWVDTVICYNLGMAVSHYKNKVISFISCSSHYVLLFIITAIVFLLCYANKGNYIVFELLSTSFVTLILLTTFKVSIGNSILYWLGKNTFNIYILQRISYTVFGRINFISSNIYLYFAASLAGILVLVLMFDRLLNGVYKLLRIA